ncbi:tRNA (adenosine(37)-N6)-threonylcarbamoyltransferase complex transferase subunit TsaD [Patescibacteria group bacterium]|nr:tRNA (adenosine(37)-N6)-threonylcarbamoyltransferase complex transferase subunit TsaD [Patescibacteria group bacterium]
MIILTIETSCDDTCISIIEVKRGKFEILADIASSQIEIHQKWGGVYPILAKREHQKSLPIVLKRVQKKANNPKIDLIGVTVGPGLDPCLWTGVTFAKDLAKKLNLKIVPVNHIEAHVLANWFGLAAKELKNVFPALCLVVSGGHTQLILMKDIGKYKLIGETRDDAAGECFDKTARILGLEYPGGPAIAKIAKNPKDKEIFSINLPRPMIYQKNYDFSFSGLKTAVLYDFKKRSSKVRKSKKYIQEMAAEIQQAIIDVLIKKTIKAAEEFKVKTIILGGGVSANKELRKQIEKKIDDSLENVKILMPALKFCTDNAVMIGAAAFFNKSKSKSWEKIKVNANLKI